MQWNIDPSHTSLQFAVRHLGISTVRGRFTKVAGTLEATQGNTPVSIEATIDAASIDTAEPQRDAHLRSPDFLDAAQYPEIIFKSTSIETLGGDVYKVTGDLTIRGETRPITFEAEIASPVNDPWGNLRAGATVTGKLNRKDWGLAWNQVTEFGSLFVGEEVRFTLDLEAVALQPAVSR